MEPWHYKPAGPVAREFLRCNHFVQGIMGPVGSGKSTVAVMKLLKLAQQQAPGPDGIRRSRWAIIRNTYPELKTTTIKTWEQWVPLDIGRWQGEGPPTHFVNMGDVQAEFIFLGLDRPEDVRKLLSLELTGAWVNEARETPKAIIDALTARVGRYPAIRDGGATWFGIIMDTNPPDTDHWWYRLAEENCPSEFKFFRQPAGDGPDAENLENLPTGYYERAKLGKSEDWVRVYIKAEYGYVRDGKPVWNSYVDNIHCQPCQPIHKTPIIIGVDFGLTPAAVFAQRDVMGRWNILSELVATDMGAVRFAELLGAEMRGKYEGFEFDVIGDPAGDNRAQTDETTPMMILRAAGIPVRPAPTNDPVQRIEAVSVALNRLIDGRPGFTIDPSCRVLRKGMIGAYAYRRIQVSGTEKYADRPDKNQYSHVADALQYAMIGAGEGRALIKQPERYINRTTSSVQFYDPFGRWK